MALTPDQVPGVASRVLAMREREQYRLQRISDYMRGRHDSVYVPNGAREEYKWLLHRSVVNFLPLVVSVIAENLHVDGYLPTNPEGEVADPASAGSNAVKADPSNPWSIWHANRMQARQHGLHRAVAKYGVAYTVVLPGTMQDSNGDTTTQPVIRAVSPRKLTALYADDIDDEWPALAVEVRPLRSEKGVIQVVRLYDDTNRYTLVGQEDKTGLYWPEDAGDALGGGWQNVVADLPSVEEHGLGVCPVVRFLHEVDLDGEMDVSGEVEPLIPLQDQVNTTTFNQLMSQQYAAFRQRWVTGMVPTDEDGRPQEPFRSGVDRLWVAEDSDTKFGEFGQTDLGPLLDAREASIRHMSTVAQVPPYHLLGAVANLPLALDTPVLTPLGRKMMGDLKRGDEVFAPSGETVKVKALSPVFRDHECFKLRFDDGTEIVADAQHRWETTHFVNPDAPMRGADLTECPECGWEPGAGRAKRLGPVRVPSRSIGVHRRRMHGVADEPHTPGGIRETSVVTTEQIAESVRTHQGRYNHYIPLAMPHDGPEQDYLIDPYVLGVWLGDGERYKGYITSHKDDVEETAANLRECGEFLNVRPYISGAKKSNCWTICIVPDETRCPYGHVRVASKNGCPECRLIRGRKDGSRCGESAELPPRVNMAFRERLRLVGAWGNKHIPEQYFQGSFKQRLALLQGLMDTDGTVDRRRGSVAIGLTDERLIRDVHRLICSLGHKAVLQDRREYTSNMGTASRRWIAWSALDPVFRMSRKAVLQRTEFTRIGDGRQGYAGGAYGRYVAACEKVESVPVRCIVVDSPEHQFCATDALVSCCNSAEALAAARDGLDRKISELQGVLSEPHKQTLRLAGHAAGNDAAWEDRTSTVVWRDTSARAFAATADALGKVSQMLGVPATELWSRIPGVSAEEVARWKAVASSQGALAELNQLLESQSTRGAQTTGPDQNAPFQGPALSKPKGI